MLLLLLLLLLLFLAAQYCEGHSGYVIKALFLSLSPGHHHREVHYFKTVVVCVVAVVIVVDIMCFGLFMTSSSSATKMKKTEIFHSLFLDAFSHLYKRVCPSVRPSVTHELNF